MVGAVKGFQMMKIIAKLTLQTTKVFSFFDTFLGKEPPSCIRVRWETIDEMTIVFPFPMTIFTDKVITLEGTDK